MAFHPFRDFGLKAVAVALATLLWLSVAGEPVVERGLEVPLEFENVPSALEIAGSPPDVVHVRVRGSSGIVSRLEPGEVVAVLDLAGERPGRRLFDLFGGQVHTPSGVEVTQVLPATVTVTLERAGSPRTVPIVPDIEGQPAEGFVVGRITTVPPTVDLIGPESRLQQLTEALTEPVSVEDAAVPFVNTVTVGVADPRVRVTAPLSATVTVEILPAPLERTLHEVPVAARNLEGRRRAVFEPNQVTVSVRGPRNVVRGLDNMAVQAFVDLADFRPGRYNLPVAVESGGELGITHIDPPFVRITLR